MCFDKEERMRLGLEPVIFTSPSIKMKHSIFYNELLSGVEPEPLFMEKCPSCPNYFTRQEYEERTICRACESKYNE